jgi:hypothetical protein
VLPVLGERRERGVILKTISLLSVHVNPFMEPPIGILIQRNAVMIFAVFSVKKAVDLASPTVMRSILTHFI